MEAINEIYVGGIPLFGASYVVTNNGYTPQAAVANVLYSGNAPVAQSYDNVEEPFEIFVKGATEDACVANKRALDLALRTARYTAPCVLSLNGKGQTKTGYAEIYSAKLQEGPEFIGKESGARMMRVSGTWVRSAFWGASSLDATGVATTTYTNNGSGNLTALGALNGDLIYEGSPLNLRIDGPAASQTDVGKIWLATAQSRVKTTHTTANSTTSTTTGSSILSATAIDCTPLLANAGVNLALFIRFSSVTAGNKAQFALQIDLASGGHITPITAWQNMPVTTGTAMLYAGTFNLSSQRIPIAAALSLNLIFWVRSTDGTTVGYTVDYSEAVFAYTVAETGASNQLGHIPSDGVLYCTTAQNLNGQAWLPLLTPIAYTALTLGATANANFIEQIRGQPPSAISGASLWVAWRKTDGSHVTTDTLRITANHAPLWRTLRGSG